MQVLLYDFRWEDEKTVKFQASSGHRFGHKLLHLGDEISISVQAELRCGGAMRENVWQPCQEKIEGKKKCEACRAREGNFVFTSFDGFNTDFVTPADLQKIEGPHWVYLALFNPSLMKVGVSKASRKTLRQMEQGSHQTLFIAQTNSGIEARQIETLIGRTGIADKIPASQKKDFILPDLTPDTGQSILRKAFLSQKETLKEYVNLQPFLCQEPEFIDWSPAYGLDYLRASPKSFHDVKLKVGESVSGIIRAVKGPFVILETPDEMVSLCAKDLVGLGIDFDPIEPGLKLHTALQGSLF